MSVIVDIRRGRISSENSLDQRPLTSLDKFDLRDFVWTHKLATLQHESMKVPKMLHKKEFPHKLLHLLRFRLMFLGSAQW